MTVVPNIWVEICEASHTWDSTEIWRITWDRKYYISPGGNVNVHWKNFHRWAMKPFLAAIVPCPSVSILVILHFVWGSNPSLNYSLNYGLQQYYPRWKADLNTNIPIYTHISMTLVIYAFLSMPVWSHARITNFQFVCQACSRNNFLRRSRAASPVAWTHHCHHGHYGGPSRDLFFICSFWPEQLYCVDLGLAEIHAGTV